jgi:hypothetical protein
MPLSIPSDFPVWIQFLSWRGSPGEITLFLSFKNVQRVSHLFFWYSSILTSQWSSSLCNYCTLTFSSANSANYINTWWHHIGNHLLLQQLSTLYKGKANFELPCVNVHIQKVQQQQISEQTVMSSIPVAKLKY